jgi:signal transduction histidine kinase
MNRVNTTHAAAVPSTTRTAVASLLAVARWLAAVSSDWQQPERLQQLAQRLGGAIDADHAFLARIHPSVLPPPVIAVLGSSINRNPGYEPLDAGAALAGHTPELVDRLAAGGCCDLPMPRGAAVKPASRFHALAVPIRVAGQLWGLIGLTDRARAPLADPDAIDTLQLIAAQLGERLSPAAAPAATQPAGHGRLLRAAIEGLEDGIVVYDADYRVAAYNGAWRRYVERVRPGADLRGMQLAELYREYVRLGTWTAEQADAVLREILSGRSAGIRERIVEQDDRHVRIRNFRIPGGGIVGLRTDVTDMILRERDLLRAKEVAEVASRAKSTFLASMSHELRTPLNAIIGFSDVLRQEVFGPLVVERYREYVADIHRSGTLLLSLINDIMDMARIEAGKIDLAQEKFCLASVVDEVLPLVQLRADAKRIALRRAVPESLPKVTGDRRAATQILLNIIVNAVKFTPEQGEVSIALRHEGGSVAAAVADTGPGIKKVDLARLGRPFERLDLDGIEVAQENKGTGLGLAISRALAERQNGTLWIDSEVGAGTTVTLRLPAAP